MDGFTISAGISSTLHVFFFALESLFFSSQAVQKIFRVRKEDAQAVSLWASNQGWYNLFLALGGYYGLAIGGHVGKALVQFVNLCMVGAGLVLLVTSKGKMTRGFLIQAVPALLALYFSLNK